MKSGKFELSRKLGKNEKLPSSYLQKNISTMKLTYASPILKEKRTIPDFPEPNQISNVILDAQLKVVAEKFTRQLSTQLSAYRCMHIWKYMHAVVHQIFKKER